MAALAVLILADSIVKWVQLLTGRRPLVSSEVPPDAVRALGPLEGASGPTAEDHA
jgi:hypothetical protein